MTTFGIAFRLIFLRILLCVSQHGWQVRRKLCLIHWPSPKIHKMKAAKRSRVRARLCLYNRSHGQNLSWTSGEAEPFAHYFFKTRPLQSHYRITPQYRCHVKMLLVRIKLSPIHSPSPCRDAHKSDRGKSSGLVPLCDFWTIEATYNPSPTSGEAERFAQYLFKTKNG